MLLGSIPSFVDLFKTVKKHLKPGGYLECLEYDLTCRCDDDTLPAEDPNFLSPYALQNWVKYAGAGSIMLSKPLLIADKVSNWMREAGFVDIQEKITKLPINPWPKDPHFKEIGRWNERNWVEGLWAFTYGPLGSRGLGWTPEQIEVFLVDVRKSVQDRSVHTYHNFHVVVGRKPES